MKSHACSIGVAVCALILAAACQAQELRGTVTDPSGAVVQGAVVQLYSAGAPLAETTTDDHGQFTFQLSRTALAAERTTSQTYTVAVTAEGFALASQTIDFAKPSELRLAIVLRIAPGREVVDVGGVLPVFKDQLAMSEVRESPAKDLGEALSSLDGVYKIRKAAIANDLVIRGFQQNNINVMVDGSRTYGACPGHMDPAAQHVDFAEIDRVEVTKGAFDVANQGSLGAVVNVVTKTPGIGFRFVPSLALGGFGYYNPSATISYGNDNYRVLGGFSYRRSDPYKDGSGRSFISYAKYNPTGLDRSAFNVKTGWMEAEYSPTANQELSFSYTRQQGGLILYPYLTMDANYDNADRGIVKYLARHLSGGLHDLRMETYFTQVNHFMTDGLRTSAKNGSWAMASHADTRAIGGRADVDFGRDFTFGVESYYRNWNVMGYMNGGMKMMVSATVPDVDTRSVGTYANYRHSLTERIQVSGGLRFDHASMQTAAGVPTDKYYQFQNTRATSAVDNYGSGNLRLSIALPRGTEWFVGAGTTGRLPDAEERYIFRLNGNVGDPLLPVTRNTEVSTGFNLKHGRSYVRPALFYSNLSNYIIVNNQPQINALTSGGTGTVPTARSYTNVDARIYGGEIGYAVALTGKLSLSGGGSYSRGIADRKPQANVFSGNLPEMSPLRTWAALRYVHKWLFTEIGGTAAARQNLVDADLKETPTAGWGVMNLKLGFVRNKVSGSFSIDNVLNHFYYEHLSYYRDPFASGVRVPEPGRNFFAQVKYSF